MNIKVKRFLAIAVVGFASAGCMFFLACKGSGDDNPSSETTEVVSETDCEETTDGEKNNDSESSEKGEGNAALPSNPDSRWALGEIPVE